MVLKNASLFRHYQYDFFYVYFEALFIFNLSAEDFEVTYLITKNQR